MSKKTNSVIFMVVATLVNILLLIVYFIIGFVLVGLFASYFPESPLVPVIIMVMFIACIALSFLTYSKLVKWATEKFGLEDKMDPIFTPKRNRRNRMD